MLECWNPFTKNQPKINNITPSPFTNSTPIIRILYLMKIKHLPSMKSRKKLIILRNLSESGICSCGPKKHNLYAFNSLYFLELFLLTPIVIFIPQEVMIFWIIMLYWDSQQTNISGTSPSSTGLNPAQY